jgi:flagellar biosynthetic protein FliP
MLHTPTAHFLRHYLEMVVAMLLGMVVLGIPGDMLLELAGVDTHAAGVLLIGMATYMTVPMVAWMRHGGHGWLPSLEMSAAMYVPTFAALALLEAGALGDAHAAMAVQHVVMFPVMFGVMLLRRSEYTATGRPEPARGRDGRATP